MKIVNTLLAAAALISAAGMTQAALYDRGNGMIYDSVLDVTWLQDANYAKTSGYDADGKMNWTQAKAWAGGLVYGGYNDWRLAAANLVGATTVSYDGSTDNGYNNTNSEIGHLFLELGNKAWFNTAGVQQSSGYGLTHTSFLDAGTGQTVGFLNVQNDLYWEDEKQTPTMAWTFYLNYGYQVFNGTSIPYYAWAVRDGDVATVPVPAAAWLLGSGLIGLAGLGRKRLA